LPRGHVDAAPVLALGPLSVRPQHQSLGVGLALVHSVLGAADAASEPLVALLGDPTYYGRFGFRTSMELGIVPPDPVWVDHFQVRTLTTYQPALQGTFTCAEPFNRIRPLVTDPLVSRDSVVFTWRCCRRVS
jgi:putative acetyltransferase